MNLKKRHLENKIFLFQKKVNFWKSLIKFTLEEITT